ncbi:aldehyde dehydrogenase family protein [Sinisalibacter aestuarii]|uniref:Aldehyde dehydrogenase DhaS n=1 Tax=Sinisalibacter aestuarii TaxID=2949426 RepID=A0ABQ5LQ34_9RHOB|nr:aldehyde dehydrogenase family protein [Sinisalibacter aestuarii]GKY87091.1 putative aldehyde dehydrogenase DhaS [Sinisalibacter aestuarii]
MNKPFSNENPLEAVSAETRAFLQAKHKLFIGGDSVDAAEGGRRDVIDPATGKVISNVADATGKDVDLAVSAARKAFDDGPWRKMKPNERMKIIWRLAELTDKYAQELAELDVLDEGSPYFVVKNFYISLAADHFRYFAGWANKVDGTTMPVNMDGEWHVYTVREPVGVVAQILPWNVPFLMLSWKLAPALAAGCTVIVKPAEDTPLSAIRFAEICREAGIPDGVVNILTGDGKVGAALVEHDGVDKIGFTGSTATGKAIVRASAGNLKRVSLELGGKSPVFVFPDADIDAAIPQVAESVFLNSGQACTAGSRLYIHEDVYDRVIEGVAKYSEGLKLGHGLDESTNLGPIISEKQYNRVTGLLQSGIDEGASLVAGGDAGMAGYFVRPTLLRDVTPQMSVYQEEIFGPVISAMKMTTENIDELAREANNTNYGLAASIWTSDISRAHKLAARIRAGIIWVNTHNQSDANMPWGGYKQSGWGREMGKPAMDMYTEVKSVAVAL